MSKLPKEAAKFLASMGVDITQLEPEAQDLWRQLNTMHQRSPAEYTSFISQVLSDENKASVFKQPAANNESGTKQPFMPSTSTSAPTAAQNSKDDDDEDKEIFVRPTVGFAIFTKTQGNDGVKIRDISSSVQGKTLYVNVCSHKGIQRPKDDENNIIEGDEGIVNTNGLEIPMILGQMRENNDQQLIENELIGGIRSSITTINDNNQLVLDVLVHPIVITTALNNMQFKRELVELILHSVTAETGLEISDDYDLSSKKYECGRGDDQSIPVLFPVPRDNTSESSTRKGDKKQAAKKDVLLDGIKLKQQDSSSIMEENDIVLNSTQQLKTKTNKIQELNVDGSIATVTEEVTPPTPTEPKTTGTPPIAPIQEKETKFKKGFLNQSEMTKKPANVTKDSNPEQPSVLSYEERREMDKLFSNVDSEWTVGNPTDDNDSGEMMDKLASIMSTSTLSSPLSLGLDPSQLSRQTKSTVPVKHLPPIPQLAVRTNLLSDCSVSTNVQEIEKSIEVLIQNITLQQYSQYELKISANTIQLKLSSTNELLLDIQWQYGDHFLQHQTAKASASKKKGHVKITVNYN